MKNIIRYTLLFFLTFVGFFGMGQAPNLIAVGVPQNSGGTYDAAELQLVKLTYNSTRPANSRLEWFETGLSSGSYSPRGWSDTLLVSAISPTSSGGIYVGRWRDTLTTSTTGYSNQIRFNILAPTQTPTASIEYQGVKGGNLAVGGIAYVYAAVNDAQIGAGVPIIQANQILMFDLPRGQYYIKQIVSGYTLSAKSNNITLDTCNLTLNSVTKVSGANTLYDVNATTTSTGTRPYHWEIYDTSNNLRGLSTTSETTGNIFRIDVGGAPVGTYTLVFKSDQKICTANIGFTHSLPLPSPVASVENLANVRISNLQTGTNVVQLYRNGTAYRSPVTTTTSSIVFERVENGSYYASATNNGTSVGNSNTVSVTAQISATPIVSIKDNGSNIYVDNYTFASSCQLYQSGGVSIGSPVIVSNASQIVGTGLAVGDYYVVCTESGKVSSANSQILTIRNCSLSISLVQKVAGFASLYDVTLDSPDVNINPFNWYLKSGSSTLITGQTEPSSSATIRINISEQNTGTYTIQFVATKAICQAVSNLNHIGATVITDKLPGKRIFYKEDDFEIYGSGQFGGTRDNPRVYRFDEKNVNFARKAYITLFDNIQNNKGGAGIMVAEYDSANSKHVSVLWRNDTIFVTRRPTRNSATSVITYLANKSLPIWVKAERAGNDCIFSYSQNTDSATVVAYTQITRVSGCFTGQKRFITRLAVASGSNSILANARFKYFLPTSISGGGNTGTLPNCQGGFDVIAVSQVSGQEQISCTFNSTGTYGINWYVIQGSTVVKTGFVAPTSSVITFSVAGLQTGTYTVRLQATNCNGSGSKTLYYEQPSFGNFTFPNAFVGVAKETALGVFSPHKFPDVNIPTKYNARIDNQLPQYVVMMNNDALGQFAANGTTPFKKGIWSWRNNQFQACVDFWDNCPGVTNQSFVSVRPYNERYDLFLMHNFNVDGMDADTYFRTKSISESYNLGRTFGGPFGLGDSPDGIRNRRAAHESDVEIGLVTGEEVEPSKRLAAYYAGIADKSLGLVLAQYMAPLFTFGYTAQGRYPDANGNYPSRTFPRDDGSGLTWSITNYFWNTFNLNGQDKYITDYENLFLVEEVTNISEDSWNQGKLVYSPSGSYLRKVNHFGAAYDLSGESGYNVDHVLSKSTSLIETDVYINKKMRNKETIQMLKIVCDRTGVGMGVWRWHDTQEFNQYGDRSVLALPREIAFESIMMQFMSGSKGNLFWSSPQADTPADGYNAIFAQSAIINRPISIGGETITLAGLREKLIFAQWNSEQSYDNGITWNKHKAIEWKDSQNYLPLRIAYSNDGYIVIFACRPYNLEPTTSKYRVQINGKYFEGEIKTTDWQSCYPVEEASRKDYYLKVIKVTP
jgi:hypothetical protein